MITRVILLSAALLLTVGCGSSSDSSTVTGASSLDQLPKATAAVVSSSRDSLAAMDDRFLASVEQRDLYAASTGVLLANWATPGGAGTSWSSTRSGPMCNTGNMIKMLLSEAAQADKILCYCGQMVTLGKFGSDIYDGTTKYISMTGGRPGGGGGMNMRIKFQITKTNNVITDFKMYTCQGSGSTFTQQEYIAQTFSATGATMTSVSTHSGRDSGSQRTSVTGTVNSSGQWLTKVITHAGTHSGSSRETHSMSQSLTLTQESAKVTLNGYFTGTFGGQTQSGQLFSISHILGTTLRTYAIGNGTQKSTFTFAGTSHSAIKTWLGDTQAGSTATASSDYYSDVNAATLATIGTPDTSFATGETWDCTPPAGTSFTAVAMVDSEMSSINTCNTTFSLNDEGNGGNWVNCSSAGY